MTILLVELMCPNGHRVIGTLEQYASDNPPEAFFEDISRQLYRWARATPEECGSCDWCHAPFSVNWKVTVSRTKAKTIAEAQAYLEQHARHVKGA